MAKPYIPTDLKALKPIVEAMIFASEEPLGPRTLLRLLFEEEKKAIVDVPDEEATLFDAAENANGDDGGEGVAENEAGEDRAEIEAIEGTENTGADEEGGEIEAETESETASGSGRGKATIGQKELRTIIDELNDEYDETGRPFRIIEIAGGFQFATTREYGEFVGLLAKDKMRRKLSPAALETLAIVAYRQPVTKPEVEAIRGVNCDQVLLSLLERNLIAISGRAETVGKPLLYGTTDEFLRAFGMNSLSDLPKLRELEELMDEDAHSATKPEIIPEAVTDELLEITHGEEADGEARTDGTEIEETHVEEDEEQPREHSETGAHEMIEEENADVSAEEHAEAGTEADVTGEIDADVNDEENAEAGDIDDEELPVTTDVASDTEEALETEPDEMEPDQESDEVHAFPIEEHHGEHEM